MSDKYDRLLKDIRTTVTESRARLLAKGYESSDVAAGLIMEALIEMYGLDYGEEVLTTITKRCIGYSEELMGMCIVEQFRNSGKSSEAIAQVERKFNECQDARVQRGQGVVAKAAREVVEKYGPFPTSHDLKHFPKY